MSTRLIVLEALIRDEDDASDSAIENFKIHDFILPTPKRPRLLVDCKALALPCLASPCHALPSHAVPRLSQCHFPMPRLLKNHTRHHDCLRLGLHDDFPISPVVL